MRLKKISLIILTVIVLNTFLPSFSFASQTYDYRQYVSIIRQNHDRDLKTPTINYDIYVNGKYVASTNSIDNLNAPYVERVSQLSTEFTIKVGDKITIVDRSTPGSGNKMMYYDFQVGLNYVNDVAQGGFKAYGNTNQEIVVNEPGECVLFLNGMDNYSAPNFSNWSEYGNWRTNLTRQSDGIQIQGWYFTAIKFMVEPAETEPVGDIWVKIDVPSQVEEGTNFNVRQTHGSTNPVTKIEWFEDDKHVSEHDGKFDGYRTKITKRTKFGVEITDSKGNTAYDEKYVNPVEAIDPEIHANLKIIGSKSPVEISLEDYLANKEMEVSYWVDAENSSYIGTNLGHFHFFQNVDDSQIRKYKDNERNAKEDPNFMEYISVSTKNDPDELRDAAAYGTFKFKPQDPVIKASLMLRDRENNIYDFATAYHTVELDIDSIPPVTELSIPYPFYPKEIDNLEQKTITWTYYSEQDIPYKHSIVSLYKKNVEGYYEEVFRNRIMTERQLIIEGEAEEEYEISVKVVDQLGKESNLAEGEFVIIGAVPIIDIELDNKTNPDVLKIEVFNKTPQEIEELFPTSYTNWTIHDVNNNLILEGEGEAPKSVDLDERFDRGKYKVTQHAINTIGAIAKANKTFEIVSYINFIPEPTTQFEDDMIELIDLSKYVTNKSWYIRGNDEAEYSKLTLDSENKFTRDEGIYQVKLKGTGYFEYYGEIEREVTKTVTFLSTKPTAAYILGGSLKMYKEIVLDGAISEQMTEARLQAKYPILFDHEKTIFAIEPITELGGEIDITRNQYILGEGKEIENDRVVFKAKKNISIRIDKEGWYRGSYKVYNGRKESDWYVDDFYVSPELLPSVDINVGSTIVYRDPDNQLKSKLEVIVDYSTPDDKISQTESKLLVYYDENNDGDFTNDWLDSMQWIMKDSNNVLEYFSNIDTIWGENKVIFNLSLDNADKNFFGRFKFDFIAVEEPLIPNKNDLGQAPIMIADTFLLDSKKKIILVDNDKPKIFLETTANNAVTLWILEDSNKEFTDDELISMIQRLEIERIKVEVYIINAKTGTVRKYK